jgi:hypothetical protein
MPFVCYDFFYVNVGFEYLLGRRFYVYTYTTMASDRQQWQRAEAKWRQLMADKAFSTWPSLGKSAIICCGYSSEGSSVEGFRAEAFALADNLRRGWPRRPEVIIGPSANDVDAIF